MLRRRRCEPCRSPFPRMLDIYTAVQIRGQSAAALTPGALVNDGRTATVGCALRLAWAVGRALGNFAVNEAIAWTGAPLRRLAAPFPPPSDRGCRLCRFSISTVLWRCRSPPRGWRHAAALPAQHIALQPRVVPAGRLQRALGDGELDALALKARIELIDAPFGLGPIGSSIDLDFGDAVGQRLDLL